MTGQAKRVALELRDLSFRFSPNAGYLWDGLSLVVKEGEAVLVEGRNGSGKSTLLDVIQGRRRASSGEIWMLATEVSHWPSWKRCSHLVARSFQEVRYPGSMKAWEVVALGLKNEVEESLGHTFLPFRQALRRKSVAQRQRRAVQTLDDLGWGELAMSPMRTLSGGQRKIVEYGLLSLRTSQIFLLDEPLMGLSDQARRHVVDFCSTLLGRGVCLMIVEHADRSGFLRRHLRFSERLDLHHG